MKYILVVSMLFVMGYCFAKGGRKNEGKHKTLRVALPEGMKYVPSGSFMQAADGGVQGNAAGAARTIQVTGMYMDAACITNKQYREFTDYVRDSIANTILGNGYETEDGHRVHMKKIRWNDPKVQEQLADLYLPGNTGGVKRIDVSKLCYSYSVMDKRAANAHPNENPIRYIVSYTMPVYPDTTVWLKGAPANFNDPAAAQYNWHKVFDDYPVAGVNLKQCYAYCDWRTKQWQATHHGGDESPNNHFRLPTEEEWEWAARSGQNNRPIPFVTQSGHLPARNFFSTRPYEENSYGLNMRGNLGEWTISGTNENDKNDIILHYDHRASIYSDVNKRYVRGGGSPAGPGEIGMRYLVHTDSSAYDIGFRCVWDVSLPANW